jgi:hypothetical protein
MLTEIVFLMALTAAYFLTIAAIFFVLSKIGFSTRGAILMTFLVFGLIRGAVAWAWQYDSANIYACCSAMNFT